MVLGFCLHPLFSKGHRSRRTDSKGDVSGIADVLRQLGCSLNSLPVLSEFAMETLLGPSEIRANVNAPFQGDLVDLLPLIVCQLLQVETSGHGNIPGVEKLWSGMTIRWKRGCFFSHHIKASLENHSRKIKAALNGLTIHQHPFIRWVSCSPAGFLIFLLTSLVVSRAGCKTETLK